MLRTKRQRLILGTLATLTFGFPAFWKYEYPGYRGPLWMALAAFIITITYAVFAKVSDPEHGNQKTKILS